jgi:hypothetical protein
MNTDSGLLLIGFSTSICSYELKFLLNITSTPKYGPTAPRLTGMLEIKNKMKCNTCILLNI